MSNTVNSANANKVNLNPNIDPTKVKTGIVRLSYANVWKAKSINGGTPKYSVSVIIQKNDSETLGKINKAIEATYRNDLGKLKGGNNKSAPLLSAIKTPLRDGDSERPEDEAYQGCYFVNANSAKAPGIVDLGLVPITDTSQVYSGVYARVSLSFYAFNVNGNKGVACGLQNIQKVRDGEPLGGKPNPEEDFDDGFSVSDEDIL
ncbi:MAG: DUF2815 family protein [Oscillospiraceae bacterium]|jgi:hypothetical protein|nr:DUF2815 family protein [Oscillospiraceae bacterium]